MSFRDATLLIIGHGSTVNDDSGATVLQHAAELRRRGIFADVRAAFFKIEPRIGPALADIRTPRVFVVPLFVSEGYFTRQAIPCELGLPAGSQDVMPCVVNLSGREIHYCQPVGTHPLMTELILARACTALSGDAGSDCSPPSFHPFPCHERAAGNSGLPLPFGTGGSDRRADEEMPLSNTALVIAGHGTALNPDSRKSIERQVELIAARNIFAEVHPAFLEEEPRIADIPAFVRAPEVVVVPFFMSDGLHVCEDIPVLLGERAETVLARLQAGEWAWRNPTERAGKRTFYTRGIGSDHGIADVILERVRAAVGG